MEEQLLTPRAPRKLEGYSYTAVEQAKKDAALRQAARDFPDVPLGWREWAYDYIVKEVGEEEFERRMNTGYYEKNLRTSV